MKSFPRTKTTPVKSSLIIFIVMVGLATIYSFTKKDGINPTKAGSLAPVPKAIDLNNFINT